MSARPPLTISISALPHLRELIHDKATEPGQGLRIAVEKGGCSGMQYSMSIATKQEGDIEIGSADAPLFVAADSTELLSGCVVEYVDELTGAGFKIFNPNAVRTCGCGTSFEPALS